MIVTLSLGFATGWQSNLCYPATSNPTLTLVNLC
jgi:hypothetical protein